MGIGVTTGTEQKNDNNNVYMHPDERCITKGTSLTQDLSSRVGKSLDVNGDFCVGVCKVSDWLNAPKYPFEP